MTRIVHVAPHRQVWLVGFGDVDAREPWHWTRPFSRRGYRHVIALSERHGGTIVVNPLTHRIDVDWLQAPLGHVVRSLMARGFWFLAYESAALPQALPPRLLTCVEIAKAVLGIRDIRVFTARQLYRRLRALGALPVVAVGAGSFSTKEA